MKRESVLLHDWVYIEISLERISSRGLFNSIGRRRAECEQRGVVMAGRGIIFPASCNYLENIAGGPTSDLNNKHFLRRLGDLK
jgi:hypothetical protein